jgi:NADH-quinone oxidoreductase subunit L
MAVITLAVPVTILVFAHWLVAEDVFQKQGAVVLLFFGWVTGAQLIFSTYRMRTEDTWRLMGLILFSFTIVVLGYTLISHAFDLFLYPDPAFRSSIYTAAGIDIFWFDVLVILMTLVVVLGWLATYYAEQNGRRWQGRLNTLRRGIYRLVARELFVSNLYDGISHALIRMATRLNVLLRCS